jgi:class 3 adenylate cyclase
MTIASFKDDIADEIAALLDAGFSVEVSKTNTVPHSNDPAITFPNLDTKVLKCKLIETCVLYIDIRRSTTLNLQHRAGTVAKLYSSFVRSMTKCAIYYGGHVRGIIGDRVMVIFDSDNCFANAVDTAVLMNSTVQFILNKHFLANEIKCGIGIDYGRMLVAKTGIRKHGAETHNYKNLVWLGRPANIASKLTDLANKQTTTTVPGVIEGFYDAFNTLQWRSAISVREFIDRLQPTYLNNTLSHVDPQFRAAVSGQLDETTWTSSIMMTDVVKRGYYLARPLDVDVVNNWWRTASVNIDGYNDPVWQAGVYYGIFDS